MKSVYLLLGEANTKKSSTVRCLLGVDNNATEVEVQFVSGMRIHIRALISAAQEQPLSPQALLKELNNNHWRGRALLPGIRNALVPLRYDTNIHKNGKTYPPARDYFIALLNDGWTIKGSVSLGEEARDWLKESGLPYISVSNSGILPGSIVGAKVREAFGWI